MKKIRVILSFFAFLLALGAAASFKKAPLTDNPKWVDTSGPSIVCRPTSETCDGGFLPCQKFVPDAQAVVPIYHEDEETLICQPTLTMSGL